MRISVTQKKQAQLELHAQQHRSCLTEFQAESAAFNAKKAQTSKLQGRLSRAIGLALIHATAKPQSAPTLKPANRSLQRR